MLTVPIGLSDKQDAEQGVATNRLPTARRKRHDNSTINREIGARSQAACGSTHSFGIKIHDDFIPPSY